MKVARRSAVPPFAVMEILATAKELRAKGRDVVILCAGEPASGAPRAVREAAAALLAHGDLGYTEATGVPRLRDALARHYVDTYRVPVDPASIAVTTGSSGAFLLAFLAAFDAGDRVALARPGYPAYANILSALGCEVVDLPCGPEQRYQPTVAQLEAAGHLDGLVVASPANPTGTMVSADELAAIAAWCARTGTRLVSDEIYHGITYTGAPGAATAAAYTGSGALVVSSFSKFWGMTGWRLGWLVLPDDLVGPVGALAGNLALCPPSLAQHAALAAFSDEGMAAARAATARYAQCRDLLMGVLPQLGWDPVAPADGAFYLYGDVSAFGLDSPTYCARLLDEAGVALTPGTDFDPAGGRDWVRLSFAVAPDELRVAIDRIVAWQRTLPGWRGPAGATGVTGLPGRGGAPAGPQLAADAGTDAR
ncbi:MAG TPA: aminotransferase class I/II-fold pyridoxal phosphate-dependent enzyme [Cellulomonas sp.]